MTLRLTLPKFRWTLLFAIVGLLLLATVLVRWWRGPVLVAETVIRRDFVQTVVASGHVETPNRVDVGTQITGTVVRVPVAEGQSVKAGDVLVELDPAELLAAERQADVAVIQAQARGRQLREVQAPVADQALRQARANLENSRSVLRRNQDLAKKGFISDAALDESRRAVDVAESQVAATRTQSLAAAPEGSDSALARAAVAEAGANAQAARARSRHAVISAVVDGTLISRNVEVGDVVQAGKLLMTLSPDGAIQLVVDIDERNLRLLKLGQKALASADAYPKLRFSGELRYINPGINPLTGAVQVKLDVLQPPSELRQDMTVSVDIEVARRPQALLVPASALHDADGPAPWVLRVEEGHAVRRAVGLGLRSGGFAEALDGLTEGDRLIPAGMTITAGARVRTTESIP